MRVYRVAKSRYIHDLSGEGSRLYGSRWASPGVPVLYTSESRALAILEFCVHMLPNFVPANVALATLEIPDTIIPFDVDPITLPASWTDYPPAADIQAVGSNLFASGHPVLRVPSVIVPHEFNFAINTDHPGLDPIGLISVEDFPLDKRLGTDLSI